MTLMLPVCVKTPIYSHWVRWQNVWMILTVFAEILQRGADLGMRCGARHPLQRIIEEPRRDSTYKARNKRCVCLCVVLASLLSWQDFNSGFQTPTWLYLYEHFHCLMNPGEVEKHKRVSNAFKTHLNQLQKSFFMSGRSDHLVTNESQALSSCTPRSVSINHATSCWPAGPLWCKLRAAPKTRWVQFVLLTKRKRGSKARGRLGVYLPAFSADVFMPLGPFNNSGSASRWHWFRKSQTWFTQQIWALIITYALAFFSRITVKFSFFFPFLDIKHSITDSPVCIYGWT